MASKQRSFGRGLLAAVLSIALPLAAADAEAAGRKYKKKPRNADYQTALTRIEAGDYQGAIPSLERAARARPEDADLLNLLGFTHRKTGQLDEAEGFYREALRLDPKHRGAHEYLGELHLQRGDLAAAEGQLATLERLCWLTCAEKRTLARSIERYREQHPTEE